MLLRKIPRPSISLLVAVVAVVGFTVSICALLGLGDVAIYAALVALYLAMGAFGGTLRADLSVALMFALGLLVFVSVPVLVSMVSFPAGAVLLVFAVGLCGIIPALGPRYGSVRLGIGLITVYAFGYESTRGATAIHIIVGSFIAFAIILLIRLIAAIPDPDAPLRHAVAKILVDNSRGPIEAAIAAWFRGPARTWMRQSLTGAAQYRAAMWTIEQRTTDNVASSRTDFTSAANSIAQEIARTVRARQVHPETAGAIRVSLDALEAGRPTLDPADQDVAKLIVGGLRDIAVAAVTRDRKIVSEAASINCSAARGALRAAISLDSDYFRNALRSMASVAVALLIVFVADQPAFALPLLMGAYGVQQNTFLGSVTEARRRSVGVIIGAIITTIIIGTASPLAAAILSGTALVVAFAYIATSIAIFMGGLVVTLTIAVAPLVHVDPTRYAIGYALAVMIGAAIATTVGYLTIPQPTPERRQRILNKAMNATAHALESVGRATPSEQRTRILTAFRAQQNTVIATSDDTTEKNRDGSPAVRGLNLICLAMMLDVTPRSSATDQTRSRVVDGLRSAARNPLVHDSTNTDSAVIDALDQLMQAEYHRLHTAVSGGPDTDK